MGHKKDNRVRISPKAYVTELSDIFHIYLRNKRELSLYNINNYEGVHNEIY